LLTARRESAPRAPAARRWDLPLVSQPKLHWSAYLWPGLPQVWLRGSWAGLALAIGFTAIANVLLVATLVWDEWLPGQARSVGLAGLGVIWVLAALEGRAEWRRLLAEWSSDAQTEPGPDPRSDQQFSLAQVAYLAGDWVSAERTLLELVRRDSRDAEARLMLATLWRHEGRWDAAVEQLDRLERLETAAPWTNEIKRERERICADRVKTVPRKDLGEEVAADEGEQGEREATQIVASASPDQAWPGLTANSAPTSKPAATNNSSPAPAPGTQIAETNRRMAA
jgi:hypothetical protein